MKYFLDTEFIEYPCTIDLISIGIVAEDGREFYEISSEFDESKASQWVKDNVIVHLGPNRRLKKDIASMILDFVGQDKKPQFWGYYADYDWVVFCWLFGNMIDLPKGFPMYCRDLKQLCDSLGNPQLPKQEAAEHNALNDAKHHKKCFEFLTSGPRGKRVKGNI